MKANRNWTYCDGTGGLHSSRAVGDTSLSRRTLLAAAGIVGLSGALAGRTLAQAVIDPARRQERTLVVIFLRGGADGLSLVVPYADEEYYRARPSLAYGAPKAEGDLSRCVKLDDRFGLNPHLAPLMAYWQQGRMAAIQAVGSFDESRSHFEAMSAIERGLADDGSGPASGWIARYLANTPATDSPLRAVAMGMSMPDSLRGAADATLLRNLGDYRLQMDAADAQEIVAALRQMYRGGRDQATEAGRQTLAVLERMRQLEPAQGPAPFPETELGNALRDTATLIKADLGLEVACLDAGGWDTHVTQGREGGWMPGLMADLANGVHAFFQALGSDAARTTVLIQSEFGRRIAENGGLGTDHGRAGAMFVLGAGVKESLVQADWPGLAPDLREGPGDLRVTTDYRSLAAGALGWLRPGVLSESVFPGFRGKPSQLFAV
jgi:uncharacterized protein (DUF1501 family)